jgi:hypothetical protein
LSIFTEAERSRLTEIGALDQKFGPQLSRMRSLAQEIITEIDDLDDDALHDPKRIVELAKNADSAASVIQSIAAQFTRWRGKDPIAPHSPMGKFLRGGPLFPKD